MRPRLKLDVLNLAPVVGIGIAVFGGAFAGYCWSRWHAETPLIAQQVTPDHQLASETQTWISVN